MVGSVIWAIRHIASAVSRSSLQAATNDLVGLVCLATLGHVPARLLITGFANNAPGQSATPDSGQSLSLFGPSTGRYIGGPTPSDTRWRTVLRILT